MPSFSFPFVSVIVPARNEEQGIADCIQSLLRQDYPSERFEIIVVDNGSSDQTTSIVREFPVRLVGTKITGASRARNLGACKARGEFLAFIDSDCIAPPDWISKLLDALIEKDNVDAVGGDCRVSGRNSLLQDYLASLNAYSQREFFSPSSPSPPWLDTGNLMVRRTSFERVNGFENALFPGEDIDFSWRLILTGGRLKYLSEVFVQDRGPVSLTDFYLGNFRTGKVSFLLARRYRFLLSREKTPARNFLRRSRTKALNLFLINHRLFFLKGTVNLFLMVSGHLVFRTGRLLGRIRVDFLKRSCSVLPLPKEFCEDRLLCFSSHPNDISLSPQVFFHLLDQVEDWEKFLHKALGHRLIPRLYFFLKRKGANKFLAPELWKKIELRHLGNQAYVLAHEAELEELLALFEKEGIEVLLLKGAALSQTVYREKPVRFFVDLDLLIRPGDWERTDALLRHRGYQPHAAKSPFPTRWHEEETRSWLKKIDFAYTHPEKQTNMDLHIELFENPSAGGIGASELWQSARQIPVGESRAWIPDPNHLFLHLLFHLAKHLREGQNVFGWYLDLDECLRSFQEPLDGGLCWKFIQKSPFADKILELLASIHSYFSTPLPKTFLSLIEERGIEPLALENIFSPPLPSDLASFNDTRWMDRREQFLAYLQKVPGVEKKIFYILRWLFPDRNYLEDKYPFGNVLERIRAYGRHWAVMAGKGVSVGLYLVSRGLAAHLFRKKG